MSEPKVSIIIACREIDRLTRESVEGCLSEVAIPSEILIVCEKLPEQVNLGENVRVVAVGKANPAAKRNRGVKVARGSIMAFIDSDAFPVDGWLANACRYLEDPSAGCVGGPNINPPQDSLLQKASGDVYATYLAMGKFCIRYRAAAPQEAPELPSCNLIVKRDVFEKIGGFDESIASGEDAKLCYQIRALGRRVLYRPDVAVFHHRRPLFLPHARQVWMYATDKSKVYHDVHGLKKWYYWSPTILITGVLACVVCAFFPATAVPARILLALYVLLIVGESLTRSVARSLVIAAGVITTHFTYGVGFVVGLMRKNAKA